MSGTQYNAAQLAMAAADAGFRGHGSNPNASNPGALDIIVAIALAETGGQSETGDINKPHAGCSSNGPWQVNYCPDRDAAGGVRDPVKNLDVFYNAQAAYQISRSGTSFTPWTTYTSGKYRAHLGEAWDGVETYSTVPDGGDTHNLAAFGPATDAGGANVSGPNLDAKDPTSVVGKAVSAATSITDVFDFIADPHNWLRVAVFVGGLGLATVGLYMLAESEGAAPEHPVRDAAIIAA